MWKARLELYRQEKEKERMQEQQQQENDEWRQEIIQAEKERLLREHLPYIDGFMPKGIIQEAKDTRYFQETKQLQQVTRGPGLSSKPWLASAGYSFK